MANFEETKGSCFCGANQFAIMQPAVEMHHCHCGSPLTINLDALPDVVAVSRACIDPKASDGHPAATLRDAFWPDRVPWLELHDDLRKADGFDS